MNDLTFPAPLRQCFADVYEPAEDSFFLLDILENELFSEISRDCRLKKMKIAVEICCGSGIVTVNLARRLKDVCFFCTDVNPSACSLTADVARLSNCSHNVQTVQTDMCAGIDRRLEKSVDLLYCNPPYVPIDEEEEADSTMIGKAWAGGKDGVETVINRFLSVADKMLSQHGVAYLLLLDKNKPDDVIQHGRDNFGFHGKVLSTKKFFNEVLSIVKFWH